MNWTGALRVNSQSSRLKYCILPVDELPGVKIGGRNINNLRYADDTVLLAETEEDFQKTVDQVKRESGSFGLLMNAKKTKTMVFSRSSNPPNTSIHIEGKLIEKVQTFTYLTL